MSEYPSDNSVENTSEKSAKTLATLVYILQAASFIVGITYFAAIVINYVKRDEVRGTVAQSHFEWQIRTFWISLGVGIIGFILLVIVIGYFVLLANAIWVIYRIVKGWLYLNDNKPIG